MPSPAADEEDAGKDLSGQETEKPVQGKAAVYGLGRGGIARGCGRGYGHGRCMSALNRQGSWR